MTSEKAYAVEARLDTLTSAQTDWIAFGPMSASWAIGGTAHYRLALGGIVHVQLLNITVGTTANATTIWTSGNGLPAGFRPGGVIYKNVRTDVAGSQSPAFRVDTDGHFECYGFAPSATRADGDFSFLAEN